MAGLNDHNNPLLEIRSPNNNPAQKDTAASVCNWATTVICSQQGLIPVQSQHSNCNKPVHHLCQIAWENMNGIKEEGCETYCKQHNKFWRDHQASKTHNLYPEPSRQATQEGPSLSMPIQQEGTRRESNPGAWPPVVSGRRPSDGASDTGGRLLTTEAKRTTCFSRRQEAAKRATTCRNNQALLRSF